MANKGYHRVPVERVWWWCQWRRRSLPTSPSSSLFLDGRQLPSHVSSGFSCQTVLWVMLDVRFGYICSCHINRFVVSFPSRVCARECVWIYHRSSQFASCLQAWNICHGPYSSNCWNRRDEGKIFHFYSHSQTWKLKLFIFVFGLKTLQRSLLGSQMAAVQTGVHISEICFGMTTTGHHEKYPTYQAQLRLCELLSKENTSCKTLHHSQACKKQGWLWILSTYEDLFCL